jgi:hypothetical protein
MQPQTHLTSSRSVLNSEYIPQSRPYSNKELAFLRSELRRRVKLGTHMVYHARCKHFYYTKENSRKEKEVLESGQNNVGNCSVCWRLSKTPYDLRNKAYDLVDEYMYLFRDEGNPNDAEKPKITYDSVDIENIYYRWLYTESNNHRRPPREMSDENRDEAPHLE